MKHLAIAAILALAPLSAQAEVYVCDVKPASGHESWLIPPTTIIEHDRSTGEVTVFDGLIKEIYGQPIEAKITTDNAKRTSYSWKVSGLQVKVAEGGTAVIKNMLYKFTIIKKDLSVRTSMKPLRFRNTFRGEGKCESK